MEEFTIYYGTLPDGTDKIGVDSKYPNRIKKQRMTDGHILEVHTDVYEVSRRERDLQLQYGLRVDDCPYHTTYFKNKSAAQSAKISASKSNVPMPLEHKLLQRRTTLEFDALILQDLAVGISQQKIAVKHNTSRGIVRRIIRNMNG
jgi:hypothetical protein|tara:strand:- start:15 stop:452 length:438 start_codon:yes stop_codon:yes gene_type:complete